MKKATVNEIHEVRMQVLARIKWGRRARMARRLNKGVNLFKNENGVYMQFKLLGRWKKNLIEKLTFFAWLKYMEQKAKCHKESDRSEGVQG